MELINDSGYDTLKKSLLNDINSRNEGNGRSHYFKADGCNWEECPGGSKADFNNRCFHRYCNKFKWIIERAKHYAEKLQIDASDLLTAWERQRTYWYMNFYQEANQPLIESNHVKVFDTIEDLKKSIGESKFRCPFCKGISTNPYECNSGKKIYGKICDWKINGLLILEHSYVFVKDRLIGQKIFTPLSWEH